jgi:hypothetical protein
MATASEKAAAKKAEQEALQEEKRLDRIRRLAIVQKFKDAKEALQPGAWFSTTKEGEKVHAEKLKDVGPDHRKKKDS